MFEVGTLQGEIYRGIDKEIDKGQANVIDFSPGGSRGAVGFYSCFSRQIDIVEEGPSP